MSHFRLAATGAIALALSSAASAGCSIGCGALTPHGHYPTIYPPTALYYPPPSPAHHAQTSYSYPPVISYRPVAHVETATVLTPVTVLRPVQVRRLVTSYVPAVTWGY